ncbi:MAG TPA: DUF1553 domain-containing protein [Planctomycetaceae bacterium]|nr:DUF1553 domain-containing protein [Planctomycetaceae bacterium]
MFRYVSIQLLLLLVLGLVHTESLVAQTVDFDRDIRPIFSNHCYACHGPDAETREADLRLDVQASLFAVRDEPLITPGDVQNSQLIHRITSKDDAEQMPPADFLKPLSADQISLLQRWVKQGAQWKDHWAWTAPQRPSIPVVKHLFIRNDIDRFVLAKLKDKKVKPSKRADRITLIRRLYFDLTGLPPTFSQVQAFVENTSSSAYQELVTQLLAQPQFGERMAMYWLDVVRYADSNGYHADKTRQVSPYRDYVIEAFNSNKPYDEFVREQLAGDLIPNATIEQQVASAFNMLLQTTDEGGAQAKEYLAKYAADRVRNTATAFMGVTFGCAQCHDHKYDPFTTKDFYQFASFFADISEVGVGNAPVFPVIDAKRQAAIAETKTKIANAQVALASAAEKMVQQRSVWEASLSKKAQSNIRLTPWQFLGPLAAESFDLAHDKSFFDETVPIDLETPVADVAWKQRDEFVDGKIHALPANANIAHYLFRTLTAPQDMKLVLQLGSDDGIRVWVNGNEKLNKKIARGVAANQEQVTVDLEQGENQLLIKISQGGGGCGFYFNYGSSNLPADIQRIILIAENERSEKDHTTLASHFRDTHPDLAVPREVITNSEKTLKQLTDSAPKTLMTKVAAPRTTRILPRGNWQDDSGEEVQPAVPEFMLPLEVDGRRANRLDLADWMIDSNNPLTARVFVNRLWKILFGNGLAQPLDDIGSQGSRPLHPELLDWLAIEFMESGWDVKHMVKLLVASGTYQQSSNGSAAMTARDPYNHLLARQTQFRLDAEMVRDNALAVSGLLTRDIGGVSVKPYQPVGYWKHMNFPKRKWTPSAGDNAYRRGLYTHWQRMFLHPSLLAFDAPSREECTVERSRSNTPQQALVLLNDPTYVEAARVFAQRIINEGGTDSTQRLNWAFETALSRQATKQESNVLMDVYGKHLVMFQADTDSARSLVAVGNATTPTQVDVAEHAAWTSIARIIFNLHESITRN